MSCPFTTDEEVVVAMINELGWFVLWRQNNAPVRIGEVIPPDLVECGQFLPQRPFYVLGPLEGEEEQRYLAWIKRHEIPLHPVDGSATPYKVGCD